MMAFRGASELWEVDEDDQLETRTMGGVFLQPEQQCEDGEEASVEKCRELEAMICRSKVSCFFVSYERINVLFVLQLQQLVVCLLI